MSPSRRNSDGDPSAPSVIAEDDDSGDHRTWESDSAEAVRNGELSAAQLPEGHGNVDPAEPDAQYPPGIVDNRAAVLNATDDPASFVPERRNVAGSGSGFINTAATPDYGTNAEG